MNSILINLKKSNEDLFLKSKWWGNPDLPKDFEEPDCSTFICQIRCDEIAEFDKDNLLPHKGMLYFFAEMDYYFGNYDTYAPHGYWDSEDVRVIYVEDLENQEFEQIVYVDDDDNPIALDELAIEFSIGAAECDGNKLLGEPYDREWEDWDEPYAGWTELLQVISDDYEGRTLNFMDWGSLHILINPKDLKDRNFNKVTAYLCST